jgi:LPXTG-site transpeptidase (sortase) family protein
VPAAGPSQVGPVLPASPPVALSVPAIGIGSPLIQLGLDPDGSVEVPSLDDPDSKPGWYRNSPAPGMLGPAIILGHVDSRQFGPGVFFDLQKLRAGDSVEISRQDGTVAIFSIDSVQTVQKSDFPTLRVYGNLDHAGLRLITCGGEFDPDAQSYESNVIVFASLTGSRAA